MKIVVDMNLSPDWVAIFQRNGIDSTHWSDIGDPRAADRVILKWAGDHQQIVLTHDLDFGTALALTHATGPSVVLLRAQDNLPKGSEATVIEVLRHYESELASGAILVIDEHRSKVRLLPL